MAPRASVEIAESRDSAVRTRRTDHVDLMDSQDSLAPQDRPEPRENRADVVLMDFQEREEPSDFQETRDHLVLLERLDQWEE